jgi:periplasmic divalent cation tolerance protein
MGIGESDATESAGLLAFVAVPNEEVGRQIARLAVERRAAAAVQLSGPILSTYWWQDEIEEAQEWLCTAILAVDGFAPFRAAVETLHPYEVPEIVAVPLSEAAEAFRGWIAANAGGQWRRG